MKKENKLYLFTTIELITQKGEITWALREGNILHRIEDGPHHSVRWELWHFHRKSAADD